jgi:amidase
MYDEARRRAQESLPDGPFQGVPILLKDLIADYAGVPITSGSRFYGDYRPARHSSLVERLLGAGLIVVGKANTPELGIMPVTEPARFGPTRNPWDLSRTPGGSSGGSAAAVAARIVPMASGGDGGGSIRIPAACCGVFGLKPTRGRNPTGPEGELWEGFAQEHVITRSVRDSAALLDATAGPDAGAPYSAPAPERPFALELDEPPSRLRIAFSTEPPLADAVHDDCKRALEDAVDLLRELGHELVEARPELDGAAFRRNMLLMIAGQVAGDVRAAEAKLGQRAGVDGFESTTWLTRVLGETYSAGEYVHAVRNLYGAGRQFSAFLERYDAWLTPTLGAPPLAVGALEIRGVEAVLERLIGRLRLGKLVIASGQIEQTARRTFDFIPFTPLANAAGVPSMSAPLYWNEQGLPIGVMLTAAYGDEKTLFRLAAQLERARPWADRRPPWS